jgi:hypothetical protein
VRSEPGNNSEPQVLISDLDQHKQIHWLKIILTGTASNRNGLGATVRIQTAGQTYTKYNDGKSGHNEVRPVAVSPAFSRCPVSIQTSALNTALQKTQVRDSVAVFLVKPDTTESTPASTWPPGWPRRNRG